MEYTDNPHYKGTFRSIYEVHDEFPAGGAEGDFVVIGDYEHYWNADRGTWTVNYQRDAYWDSEFARLERLMQTATGVKYAPESYGAVGDGVHDDTDAILACLMQTGECQLGDGTYLIHGIKMPPASRLVGKGIRNTTLRMTGVNAHAVQMGAMCYCGDFSISIPYMDTASRAVYTCAGLAYVGERIEYKGVTYGTQESSGSVIAEHIEVNYDKGGTLQTMSRSIGVLLDSPYHNGIYNCIFRDIDINHAGAGIVLRTWFDETGGDKIGTTSSWINSNYFRQCRVFGCRAGLYLSAQDGEIKANFFDFNYQNAGSRNLSAMLEDVTRKFAFYPQVFNCDYRDNFQNLVMGNKFSGYIWDIKANLLGGSLLGNFGKNVIEDVYKTQYTTTDTDHVYNLIGTLPVTDSCYAELTFITYAGKKLSLMLRGNKGTEPSKGRILCSRMVLSEPMSTAIDLLESLHYVTINGIAYIYAKYKNSLWTTIEANDCSGFTPTWSLNGVDALPLELSETEGSQITLPAPTINLTNEWNQRYPIPQAPDAPLLMNHRFATAAQLSDVLNGFTNEKPTCYWATIQNLQGFGIEAEAGSGYACVFRSHDFKGSGNPNIGARIIVYSMESQNIWSNRYDGDEWEGWKLVGEQKKGGVIHFASALSVLTVKEQSLLIDATPSEVYYDTNRDIFVCLRSGQYYNNWKNAEAWRIVGEAGYADAVYVDANNSGYVVKNGKLTKLNN